MNDPSISMVFFHDGRLEYRAMEGDVVQIMKLTYRIDDTDIVSGSRRLIRVGGESAGAEGGRARRGGAKSY